jgi:Lar family restriction alleviation protein
MNAPDLLPCPFCGGAVTLRHYIHKYDDAFVYCDVCEIEGARTSNNDTAIAAWNRRDPAVILAAAMELPEVKALVEATSVVDAYLALVKGTGRLHPNLEAASEDLTRALAASSPTRRGVRDDWPLEA